MTTVAVTMLSKSYPRRAQPPLPVLCNVNLEAPSGSFLSIVGESGCGKSTLLRIISGLELPTTGEVCLDGTSTPLLGRSGYMPQRDALLPWRTVLDNAAVALEVQGVTRSESRRRAAELLPIFGLEGFAVAYPATLSGGMRQRVALLRTMLSGRSLLLLDEPLGALDALTRARMQEWLLGVWARFSQTVLFVTHDVDEALYLSDKIVVMSARPGTVCATLPVDLPRPRPAYDDIVTTSTFTTLKRQVLHNLRPI